MRRGKGLVLKALALVAPTTIKEKTTRRKERNNVSVSRPVLFYSTCTYNMYFVCLTFYDFISVIEFLKQCLMLVFSIAVVLTLGLLNPSGNEDEVLALETVPWNQFLHQMLATGEVLPSVDRWLFAEIEVFCSGAGNSYSTRFGHREDHSLRRGYYKQKAGNKVDLAV